MTVWTVAAKRKGAVGFGVIVVGIGIEGIGR